MTREEALQFKERWRIADERIIQEIRNAEPEVRLKQLRTMFASASLFNRPDLSSEEEAVRARWCLLKDRLHA